MQERTSSTGMMEAEEMSAVMNEELVINDHFEDEEYGGDDNNVTANGTETLVGEDERPKSVGVSSVASAASNTSSSHLSQLLLSSTKQLMNNNNNHAVRSHVSSRSTLNDDEFNRPPTSAVTEFNHNGTFENEQINQSNLHNFQNAAVKNLLINNNNINNHDLLHGKNTLLAANQMSSLLPKGFLNDLDQHNQLLNGNGITNQEVINQVINTLNKECNPIVKCPLCSLFFGPLTELSLHLTAIHKIATVNRIRCPFCTSPETFNLSSMFVHLSMCHLVSLHHVTSNSMFLLSLLSPSAPDANSNVTPMLKFLTQNGNGVSKSVKNKVRNINKRVEGGSGSKTFSSILNQALIQDMKSNNHDDQMRNYLPKELNAAASPVPMQQVGNNNNKSPPDNIVNDMVKKFTRTHTSMTTGKKSLQCLICAKWFAIPPINHLRGHMISFGEDRRSISTLINDTHVCLVCFGQFDTLQSATEHFLNIHKLDECSGMSVEERNDETPSLVRNLSSVDISSMTSTQRPSSTGSSLNSTITPPLAELVGESSTTTTPKMVIKRKSDGNSPTNDDRVQEQHNNDASSPIVFKGGSVELDNAGRVKSGKVRKQCELCGEWSNIKWFFKHMSENHQALFCRCCREYLPIHEQAEHRIWHAQPPYMGQKIRLENGRPVIIDRKERASMTPIGSLASWGGSSGGMVIKAVQDGKISSKAASSPSNGASGSKKRKTKDKKSTVGENNFPFINLSAEAQKLIAQFTNGNLNLTDSIGGHGSKQQSSSIANATEKFSEEIKNTLSNLTSASGNLPVWISPEHIQTNGLLLNGQGTTSIAKNEPSLLTSSLATSNPSSQKEICPICGIFITYKNLSRHVKQKHSGVMNGGGGSDDLINKTGQEQLQTSFGTEVCPGDTISSHSGSDEEGGNPHHAETVANDLDPSKFLEATSGNTCGGNGGAERHIDSSDDQGHNTEDTHFEEMKPTSEEINEDLSQAVI